MATTKELGAYEELADLLWTIPQADLEHAVEAMLKAATTAQLVFHARFPTAWAAWNARVESGDVSFKKAT